MTRRALLWRLSAGAGGAALALAGALQVPANAQDVQLEPPPRPVAVLVSDRPKVTVDLEGDYGPVRVTGTLESAPEGRIDYGSGTAAWNEVLALGSVFQPTEGFPAGSYRLGLVTDDTAPLQLQGAGVASGLYNPAVQGNRRVLRLPEGNITISGEPYGRLTFPVSRIVQYRQVPVRGSIVAMPAGKVTLEVLPGARVSIPLEQIQLLLRDRQAGTISVTLADEQNFTGKLVALPNVNLTFSGEDAPAAIPLERVVVLERRTAGGRRL